jgi:hypothetical protein
MNNPVMAKDPGGLTVNMVFNRESKTLYITDSDIYKSGLPTVYVLAKDCNLYGIRDDKGNLVQNQVLVVNGVFSGGEVQNGEIVRNANKSEQKPLAVGSYDILDNNDDTKPGHNGWFRLDKQDQKPYNDYDDNMNRNGFRLHSGTLSNGCVTINQENSNAKTDWTLISNILNKTSNYSVKENKGSQWKIPWSRSTWYGVLHVKGNDTIQTITK